MRLLSNVRVLELTAAWAGPLAGRVLGAMGADVVKVESPISYDAARGPVDLPPGFAVTSAPPYNRAPNYNAQNRNKRALSLDIASDAGRAVFLSLVKVADVIIFNLSPRVVANLRLDYELLSQANPRIIVLNMTLLGATGPYRNASGFGTTAEAMSGFAARFGYAHETARVSPTFFPDPVTGVHGAASVLAALILRDRTGVGQLIDLAQMESQAFQLAEGIILRSFSGREPARMGNAEPGRCPSGYYPTADGRWVAIVVASDEEFERLVAAADSNLVPFSGQSLAMRLSIRGEIDEAVGAWTRRHELDHVLTLLRDASVRAMAVNTYRHLREAPQMRELASFEEIEHPAAGTHPYLALPITVDGERVKSTRPAPRFAEHTDEVLKDWLGWSDAEAQPLREIGVIAAVPQGR